MKFMKDMTLIEWLALSAIVLIIVGIIGTAICGVNMSDYELNRMLKIKALMGSGPVIIDLRTNQ